MYYQFFYIILFVIGSSIGSFLNVIRFRYPKAISIVKPRSFCPSCENQIPFYLNVPILSWVFLRGKCFYCESKIPFSYPFVECLTGSLFVLNSFFSGSIAYEYNLNLIGLNIFTVILLIASLIDFDNMIIPNELVLVGSILGIIINLVALKYFSIESIFYILYKFILISFLGAVLLEFLNFLISLIIKKEAFGFGDIKYLFMIGCWLGLKGMICTFLMSMYIGGIVTIILILFKKVQSSGKIPFGPYLSISAYITVLFGSENLISLTKNLYNFI